MIIFGRIKECQVQIQRFYIDEVKKMEGKSIEIKPVSNSRSDQQNRYMWGVVYKLVSDHTGFTPEEVHETYKIKFLTYEKEHKGKIYKFTKSTANLSTLEFGEYLDKVINHAQGELKIIIPEPNIEYENG